MKQILHIGDSYPSDKLRDLFRISPYSNLSNQYNGYYILLLSSYDTHSWNLASDGIASCNPCLPIGDIGRFREFFTCGHNYDTVSRFVSSHRLAIFIDNYNSCEFIGVYDLISLSNNHGPYDLKLKSISAQFDIGPLQERRDIMNMIKVFAIFLIAIFLLYLMLKNSQTMEKEAAKYTNPSNSTSGSSYYGNTSAGSSLYSIADAVFEDLSYNSPGSNSECVRVQYRIWIETEGKASRNAVQALARDLVAQVTSRFDINALSIFVYDGPDMYGEYTIASVDWAPYGNWGRADEVSTGDYSKHSYTIRMR